MLGWSFLQRVYISASSNTAEPAEIPIMAPIDNEVSSSVLLIVARDDVDPVVLSSLLVTVDES